MCVCDLAGGGEEAADPAALPAGVGHEGTVDDAHAEPSPLLAPGMFIVTSCSNIHMAHRDCYFSSLPLGAQPQLFMQDFCMKSHMSTFWTGWKLETVEMLKSLSSSHAPFLVHLRHSGDLSPTLRARPLLSGNRGDGVTTSPWFTEQGKLNTPS